MTTVKFRRLPHGEGLPLPCYATPGAAGMDLCAAESGVLHPDIRMAMRTGFAVEIPLGYEGQIRPRSGLAFHHGVTVANAPGTIDCDYRGEIKVILITHGGSHVIKRGERIAQLVIAPVTRVEVVEAEELSATERGENGLGSTGT